MFLVEFVDLYFVCRFRIGAITRKNVRD